MTTRKKGYKIIVMAFVLLAYSMLVAFKSQETQVGDNMFLEYASKRKRFHKYYLPEKLKV